MIISKAALLLSSISKKDDAIPQLGNLRIEKDGTAIAASRNIIIALSPVADEAKKNLPVTETEACSATIPSELVRKVIDAIGIDATYHGKLEYANLRNDNGTLEFTVKDSRNKGVVIEGDETPGQWVPWKEMIKNNAGVTGQFILNRDRLKILLDVLDKVVPSKGGETPVYLEFTSDDNIIIRGKNYVTGQTLYGIMMSYKGQWLDQTEWEQKLRKGVDAVKKKIRRLK